MSAMIRFAADGGHWMASIDDVLGVHSTEQVRPLPDPVPGVLGVIERDGATFPVTETLSGEGRHVLVLGHDHDLVGVLADEVWGVEDIDPADLRSGPSGQRRAYVGAVHGDGTTLSYVLDAAELIRAVTTTTGDGS